MAAVLKKPKGQLTKDELNKALDSTDKLRDANPPLTNVEELNRLSMHQALIERGAGEKLMTLDEIAARKDTMRFAMGAPGGGGSGGKIPSKSGGTGPVLPRTQSSGVAIQRKASVTFGKDPNQVSHAFRHTDKKGLNRADVQKAIETDLSKTGGQLNEGLNNGRVVVNGVPIDYVAYKFPDGTINVGRITPPR